MHRSVTLTNLDQRSRKKAILFTLHHKVQRFQVSSSSTFFLTWKKKKKKKKEEEEKEEEPLSEMMVGTAYDTLQTSPRYLSAPVNNHAR